MSGPSAPNQAKLDGLNPLAYLGVRPSSPPQLLVQTRNPTVNDNKYVLGTLWLNNNSPYDLWILVNLAVGVATWEMLNGGGGGTITDLTSNTGGPVPPTAGNINVVGDGVTITGAGNAGTSTITLSTLGSGVVSTLTGNSGGAVGPNLGNINIVGDGVTVNVVGNPGANTLTISASGLEANSFPTDAGTATPAAGVLNVLGGTAGRDINTSGSGNTIHVDLKNAITLGDLSGLGSGVPALTATTGDILVSAGNIRMPTTNSGGTQGVFEINSIRFLHNRGTGNSSVYVGGSAGSITNTGSNNTGIGFQALLALTTGSGNTAVGSGTSGVSAGVNNTFVGSGAGGVTVGTGNYNTALGINAGNSFQNGNSGNIAIMNSGANESNTMRIGTSGTGNGQVSRCFLAGVSGVNVGSVASVVSISGDQLGSTTITAGSGITVTPGANSITISGSGSITFTYTNVNTTPYVVLVTDEYLSVDCSGGPITVQLANAATLGKTFIIKDRTGSAGTNNITVTTVGGAVNIDGATTFVMNTDYESINVLGNGSAYEIW